MTNVLWFRNDLRLHDNEAFSQAIDNDSVLLVYIYDRTLIKRDTVSSFHLKFIEESLDDLSDELKEKYGATLNIYHSDTLDVFRDLLSRYQVKNVFSNRIFKEKSSQEIDDSCLSLFSSKGVKWIQCNQFGIQLKHRNRQTWAKDWRSFTSKKIKMTTTSSCEFINDNCHKLDNLTSFKKDNYLYRQHGGSKEAQKLLHSFLVSRHKDYQFLMSSPLSSENSCSRLSPHITFGTISIRDIVSQLNMKYNDSDIDKKSLSSFKKRLAWHCHFIQKFYDEPTIEYENMNRAYDGMRADADEKKLEAWKKGLTGFPFVDACMRFVTKTGWLNFRMRAMLVSFASYQLWLDWRLTSKHLSKYFTDYEPGIHYSQFQMQSGTTGINTIRIYNPIKQSYDQDPHGEFIRKWIPELTDVPDSLIHEPWRLSPAEELDLGIKSGNNYPSPIVDNGVETKLARDKIWEIRKSKHARDLSIDVVNKHASNK
jgi:deoxyribodipyrimidine photo-lyase